ncbi:unnamed protein product [Gongylonema pulchrum]|uniref:MoCF_biosynth domain-containing protein n=1 Tax=Gongylonema pulchrum TaxID=637853 RepID=A0A183CWR7_9BILA|nr:unnamed protein product [Gongylonema pulchrum]
MINEKIVAGEHFTTAEGTSALVNRARRSAWPAVSVDEAARILDGQVSVIDGTRTVSIKNIKSGTHSQKLEFFKIPAADGKGIRRVVSGTTAGVLATTVLQPGTICRVNTGSMVPDGADAVVQIEDTRLVEHNETEEVLVEILNEPEIGQDVREIGCDIKLGELLLSRGCVIGAAEIGILSAAERKFLQLFKQPKVAIVSTGNEVVDSESDQCPVGSVRDTNRPQLIALVKEYSFEPFDAGIVPDESDLIYCFCFKNLFFTKPTRQYFRKENIQEALEAALMLCDVAVCSGGVSMGEKDYLKEVLQRMNFEIKFGRVLMKPGLPTTFAAGNWDGKEKLVFGLPGNPVSTWVTAHLFLLPTLKKMAGWAQCQFTSISVRVS